VKIDQGSKWIKKLAWNPMWSKWIMFHSHPRNPARQPQDILLPDL
jgi:hypothetical protein